MAQKWSIFDPSGTGPDQDLARFLLRVQGFRQKSGPDLTPPGWGTPGPQVPIPVINNGDWSRDPRSWDPGPGQDLARSLLRVQGFRQITGPKPVPQPHIPGPIPVINNGDWSRDPCPQGPIPVMNNGDWSWGPPSRQGHP